MIENICHPIFEEERAKMKNKYSRKQLEELYNCKIFKTTTCDEDNYTFWAAQGLPFTEKWRRQVV